MRRPFRIAAVALAGAATTASLAGCGGAPAPAAAPRGAPTVVTGVWALAAVAGAVGGGQARVVDVVPPGTDPATPLTAAEAAEVRAADVVVEVGGGYQPSFAAAAAPDAHVVVLAPSPAAAEAGPWLEPGHLDALASHVAAALTAVDPAGRSTWANGATDVAAEDSSLSADIHSTLATCPKTVFVTPTRDFADLAAANGLTDRVGTSTTGVAGAPVFSEPWAPGPVRTAKRRLDPLVGQPAGGYPKGATYAEELEQDLGVLSVALACPQEDQ